MTEGDALLLRAEQLYPDLYLAATHGPVSFQHIVQARRIRDLYRGGQFREDRAVSRVLERLLRQKFAETEGEIRKDFWAVKAIGGCALTDRDALHSALNSTAVDLVQVHVRVEQVARDAQRSFNTDKLKDQRSEAADVLFSLLTRVIATVDLLADPDVSEERTQEARQAVSREWSLARRRIEILIQRQARFEYFMGVLIGAPIALALFAIIGALAAAHWPSEIATPAFLGSTIAGTVGGVISVFQRMASGQLRLDYTAPSSQRRLLGAIRPAVGGTFAAIVQFALLGGLLTMQGSETTRSTPATFAFFSLVGFAAGFSERFATDMIERAGQLIVPGGSASVIETSTTEVPRGGLGPGKPVE